jgi:GT2 family glycosyltransferase
MSSLTISIVVYKTPPSELKSLFLSLQRCLEISAWVVVDNAASEYPELSASLRSAVQQHGGHYLASDRNAGFGAGHNLALGSLKATPSEYHLMLNPDIVLDDSAIPDLLAVMDSHPEAGLLMPRVIFPSGEDQHLCKLLPTPLDFVLRRFAPGFVRRMFRARMQRYELRGIEHSTCNCVPFLSGCFMLARRAVLESVGAFDERYFLYLEDVDLCRRMVAVSTLLYWPQTTIIHAYGGGAHRSLRLMVTFIKSSIRYFNKWGWFRDAHRKQANRAALDYLQSVAGQAKF